MAKLLMAFRLTETERFWLSELVAVTGKTKTEIVAEALRLLYSVEKAGIIQYNAENNPVIQSEMIKNPVKTAFEGDNKLQSSTKNSEVLL